MVCLSPVLYSLLAYDRQDFNIAYKDPYDNSYYLRALYELYAGNTTTRRYNDDRDVISVIKVVLYVL